MHSGRNQDKWSHLNQLTTHRHLDKIRKFGDNLLYRGVSEHKNLVFTAQQKIFMRHFELFFRLCDFFQA